MSVKPLDDRVVIEVLEAESKTAGGIVLPDTAKEKPQIGEVAAVGPGKMLDSGKRSPIGVKKGEKVYYAKYAGTEVKIDGETYVILKETDILAVAE